MRVLKWRGGNDASLIKKTKAVLIDLIFEYDRRMTVVRGHEDSLRNDNAKLREMYRSLLKHRVCVSQAVPEGEEHEYVTQEIWHSTLLELANAKHKITQLEASQRELRQLKCDYDTLASSYCELKLIEEYHNAGLRQISSVLHIEPTEFQNQYDLVADTLQKVLDNEKHALEEADKHAGSWRYSVSQHYKLKEALQKSFWGRVFNVFNPSYLGV